MRILKYLGHLLVCIFCIGLLCNNSFAVSTNMPLGDIGEYGTWLTEENNEKIKEEMSEDLSAFDATFQTKLEPSKFVPLEVKVSLEFMDAIASLDNVLKNTLGRFIIIFLIVMYAFWIAIEAYKMSRETSDYRKLIYDIFKQGLIIIVWIMVLHENTAKLFMYIMSPIIDIGNQFSDLILSATSSVFDIKLPNTCGAIKQYVASTTNGGDMVNTSASIMCLPARMSVYFYTALQTSLHWIGWGFGRSATAVAVGLITSVIFIKCIFKYAFMTLGIVADLFLTLLMLPFTALAEAIPKTKENNYVAQVYNGFLGMFSTKKLTDVITVFVNTAIYFISLSILISICAILLASIIHPDAAHASFQTSSAMTTILCGCLVLYLIDKTDDYIKELGGSIDNSFGKDLQDGSKKLWDNAKSFSGKIFKEWAEKNK